MSRETAWLGDPVWRGVRYRFYEVTVDDPTTWTAPWTAMLPLKLKDEMIFEYACHEGNEAVPDMLRGHRMEEREAAAKSPTNR